MAAMTAWVTHPITWVSVLIMALNDHVLKAAFAAPWTGKLSDVAGLIFAPAILAWFIAALVPQWRGARAAGVSIGLTGIGFIGANATAAGGHVAESVWSAFGVPTRLWADPTDLWCLPALAVAWLVFRRASARGAVPELGHPRRVFVRRAAAWVVLPFAVLAVAATSPAPEYSDDNYDVSRPADAVGRTRVMIAVVEFSGDIVIINPDTLQPSTLQNPELIHDFTYSTSSCVPSDPNTCYRAVPGKMGIETSADAGQTWKTAWHVADVDRAFLAAHYGLAPASALVTTSVVAEDAEGGHIVLGANGADGVVVRRVDGTWERVGWFDGTDPPELGAKRPTSRPRVSSAGGGPDE